jgi:hypothetical protein
LQISVIPGVGVKLLHLESTHKHWRFESARVLEGSRASSKRMFQLCEPCGGSATS